MSESQTKVRAQLTPMENLLVGAAGGMLETTIQMPLLTLKFATQEGRPLPKRLPEWYRGLGIQAGTLAPITAFQVMVNGMIEKAVTGGARNLTDLETIGCAMVAGGTSATLYGPVDLIMIQQQKRQLGVFDTVKYISNKFGITNGIFRGFWSTVVRESIYTGGYLGIAPVLTKTLSNSDMEMFKGKDYASGLAGSTIAGVIAAVLTHPADTSKTCMQADLEQKTYPTARAAFFDHLNNKGVTSLYKGGFARTARLCGAFFIVSTLREKVIQYKTDNMVDTSS
uniref:Mitochondrial carrier protein n=1 Tax=Lotharella globosa TaxID=91324 RepID=A0A6U2YIV5_9EUKA|mmetsp:Transcript_10373/g.19982  ORF Transcript_10373/g.19982 Transcript_10373/m.19982 type:complete len:282 (+) Transcript_10373:44-889(+)